MLQPRRDRAVAHCADLPGEAGQSCASVSPGVPQPGLRRVRRRLADCEPPTGCPLTVGRWEPLLRRVQLRLWPAGASQRTYDVCCITALAVEGYSYCRILQHL